MCRSYHVPFVINDNVDIALAMDADGGTRRPERYGSPGCPRKIRTGQDHRRLRRPLSRPS
ncbi:MAG: hypothetical protein ACLTSZ_07630 [Lachnospiraceae bacterium]